MEAAHALKLLHVDGLEDDGMAAHLDIERDDFPVVVAHLALHHGEGPALVQASQQAPAEGDVLKQGAVHAGEPAGGAIDPHSAAERAEDLQLAVGGIIMRVGKESQADLAVFLAVIFEDESVRNGLEHLDQFVFVILGALFPPGALGGVIHQFFHPGFVTGALLRGERIAIDQQGARDLAVLGVDHVAVLGALLVFAMDAVTPMRVVVRVRVDLMLDDFSYIFISVLGKRRRGRFMGRRAALLQSEYQVR